MIVNVYRDGLRFMVEAENVASAEAQVDWILDEYDMPLVYPDGTMTEALRGYGVTEVRRV